MWIQMGFKLSDELIEAHLSTKDLDTLTSSYLLTLGDGTTFDIMGGKARRIRINDRQAILQYQKADDVRKFQDLNLDCAVLLNGKFMPLEDAYRFIGTDYIPCPVYRGVDDSKKIRTELLNGREKAMKKIYELNNIKKFIRERLSQHA